MMMMTTKSQDCLWNGNKGSTRVHDDDDDDSPWCNYVDDDDDDEKDDDDPW